LLFFEMLPVAPFLTLLISKQIVPMMMIRIAYLLNCHQ